MMRVEVETLRDEAAKTTRGRIEADQRQASDRIAHLVAYIGEHLFERGLSYERMRKDCAIRDNNRSTIFGQEIGLTPAAYIRELRFDVACRLLRDTDLDVTVVGNAVGYAGPNVFGAAFRRWAGMTPAHYRRQERRVADSIGTPLSERRPDLSPAAWRRFVEGDLEDREADLLLRFLLDRYPASRRRLLRELLRCIQIEGVDAVAAETATSLAPSLRSLFAREDIEELMAEAVWESIREQPLPVLEDLVRHHLWFSTPAFFDLLGQMSRVEGREDRERGVAIARLAIVAAEAIEGTGSDVGGAGRLKALAWAWLGNARRLALDFTGADVAFRAAQQRLPSGADREAGMILSMLASLRSWQRRYEEALDVANAAVPRLRTAGDATTLVRTYLLRATVHWQRNDIAHAVEDSEAATQLLETIPHCCEELCFAARFNHAFYLVDFRHESAATAVSAVRQMAEPGGSASTRVLWLEGLFAASKEEWETARNILAEAKKRFRDVNDVSAGAVLSLDLALVLSLAGDRALARSLLEEALPMFEALMLQSETLAARVLHDDAREVTERLADILAGGLTARALQELRKVAARIGHL